MNLASNIALWTSSLIIGLFGLIFGIIASINATKANQQIRHLISKTWIVQETEKLFFEKIQKLINLNQNVIRKLRNLKNSISFLEYSVMASPTRLAPLPKFTFDALKKSDYMQLANNYSRYKTDLDEEFFKHFRDLETLKSNKTMTKIQRENMLNYHKKVALKLKEIIREYSSIS